MKPLSEKDPEKIKEQWEGFTKEQVEKFAPLILNSLDKEPTAKELHGIYTIHGIDPKSPTAHSEWKKIRKAHEDGVDKAAKKHKIKVK
jgi:hypothetical protein